MAAVIEISGLTKRFGTTTALDGLDLEVAEGEVHGFLGPNGAGKTTTLRVLLGTVRADGGTVRVLGLDPWSDVPELHARLAYVPGDVSLWPGLTGGEVIDLLARLQGGHDAARRAELLERFDLDPTKKARSYSKGNRQKVALVAALATDAELYLLDEPTSGLDPLMEQTFRECVSELRGRGRTVLLSTVPKQAPKAVDRGLLIERVGGDLELLKRLLAAGYPVLIEKGFRTRDIHGRISWMGHYNFVTGYDEARQIFIVQDSYIKENNEVDYQLLDEEWLSFNYTYILIFPSEKEAEVLALLGPDADEIANIQSALEKSAAQIYQTEGTNQFFAWYNYGTNLVKLQDFGGAAQAYDTAFGLYDALPDDLSIRPYRILWYQTGPYFAYYYTGRYYDVIQLATNNSIGQVKDDEPALEESFYWRAMARIALGETGGAVEDVQACLQYHENFQPCVLLAQQLGIQP